MIRGQNVTLFNPQGYIADQQHRLFVLIGGLLLLTATPVVLLLYFTAWKYRETSSNTAAHAAAHPERAPSQLFGYITWGFPILCLVLFVSILWPATHKLEPRKAIASGVKPMTIQVVAMRWKWLFLYPDQKIASVNYVQIPKDTPVKFELTADDAPMSSFWIPNLGGQLYAMTGHVNRLNLVPNKLGLYDGRSAEINGAGFSGMTFKANVTTAADFDKWTLSARQSSPMLDSATYANLVKPSQDSPVLYYGDYQSDLYSNIAAKYMSSHMSHTAEAVTTPNAEHEAHE
ncbi:COX aromatic rich motif-containing protein [Aeromicrobium sp.]|nr:COX aromatic rich motif-containing protein [Candidatus Saccharibacteria bacterium]